MKIAVLLSGGVDSSVALAELLNSPESQNAKIEAFYLKIWLEDELSYLGNCPWEEDLSYARKVCEQLNVPLTTVNLQKEYYQKVVCYTISELKKGYTPSPDIFCNERIKFGAFLERFNSYDKVITGHYALISKKKDTYSLYQAKDPIKDQSYFLCHLNQRQLSKISFPLGSYFKRQVREKAKALGLANQNRPDSQGICFLGKFAYAEFVKHYLGVRQGDIIDKVSNKKLGEHQGYWFYTIGQRKGLKLGGGPWYVADKDIEKNIVYVLSEKNYARQDEKEFYTQHAHWLSGQPPSLTQDDLFLKIRHGERKIACQLFEEESGLIRVRMSEPDRGIAPGQYAVIYKGTLCLGSLKIAKRIYCCP